MPRKRQKTNESSKNAFKFFPGVARVEYEGPSSSDPTKYRFYDPERVVEGGRTMKDWLKFSMCAWHTFKGDGSDPFGAATLPRPWSTRDSDLVDAHVELMSILTGVEYFAFHDVDLSVLPVDCAFDAYVERTSSAAKELKSKHAVTNPNVKCLWGTANLFSAPCYANGAATNPDKRVVLRALAQVKHAMTLAELMDAESFVFWGGREGFAESTNTNLKVELANYAKFLRACHAYASEKTSFSQLLIEPKPREPMSHQYDYDVATSYAFLQHFGLSDLDRPRFNFNVEPNHTTLAGHSFEHDVRMASTFNRFGSIDANYGPQELGWDTDMFCVDVGAAVKIMRVVVEEGGFRRGGGLNFDAKVRRESNRPVDVVIAHVGSIDAYAKALLIVLEERKAPPPTVPSLLADRYADFLDKAFVMPSLEEAFESYEEPTQPQRSKSGRAEEFHAAANRFLYA